MYEKTPWSYGKPLITKDFEMTKKTKTIDESWDSRTLGAEAAYVGVADESNSGRWVNHPKAQERLINPRPPTVIPIPHAFTSTRIFQFAAVTFGGTAMANGLGGFGYQFAAFLRFQSPLQ